MTKTLKNHASLRGVNVVNDEARLSRFYIRTEKWQDCRFNLLSQLRERQLALSTRVTLLTCKRYAFTMADRLARASRECRTQCKLVFCELSKTSRLHTLDPSKTLAFTMAEILLSLTIIGVVAAITLPSLMANINERTWNTQRKALYARMSQAIAMMPQVGGYGTLTEDESGSVTADTAAETFLTEGLSKVLKINNICDSEHLADCGVPTSYTDMAGVTKSWPTKISEWNGQFVNFSFVGIGWGAGGTNQNFSYSQSDTKAAAFETQNGETVTLYYNPNCKDKIEAGSYYSQPQMCADFIYDLNGNNGPNTVGKDIGFITTLYNANPNVVAPMPLSTNANGDTPIPQQQASAACTAQEQDSRMPNIDELSAIFYNRELVGFSGVSVSGSGGFWSGSFDMASLAWLMHFCNGRRFPNARSEAAYVRCVQR